MKYIIVFFIFTSFFSCKEFKANQISIANYPNDKKIAVSFTFDDGCPSVFSTVVPLFDEYGYKATFFITPSQVKEKNWISWKALALKGYEIGNHSMSHRDLTELDSLGILEEVKRSKEMMEEKLKIPIFSFAPPHHKSNLKVDQVIFNYHAFSRAKEGFCKWYGWTSKTTQQIFSNDIEKAIKKRDWFVPAIHGVGDCWEPIDKELLVFALDYLKRNSDEIVVETLANIGKYKVEKGYTTLEVMDNPHGKFIKLITKQDSDFYNFPLTLVVNNYDFPKGFKIRNALGVQERGNDLLIKAIPGSVIEIAWSNESPL